MLRVLGRLFQVVLCLLAIALGVWVGEWMHPTPLPSQTAAPAVVPMPAASRSVGPR